MFEWLFGKRKPKPETPGRFDVYQACDKCDWVQHPYWQDKAKVCPKCGTYGLCLTVGRWWFAHHSESPLLPIPRRFERASDNE